jgi:hypothetical protein
MACLWAGTTCPAVYPDYENSHCPEPDRKERAGFPVPEVQSFRAGHGLLLSKRERLTWSRMATDEETSRG